MEEDDEFGDLYSDVLQPFCQSSSFPSQPLQLSSPPSSFPRSFDINSQIAPDDNGASCSTPGVAINPKTDQSRGLDLESNGGGSTEKRDELIVKKIENMGDGNIKLTNRNLENLNNDCVGSDIMMKKPTNGVHLMDEDVNFDIEDAKSDPIIPGLSGSGSSMSMHTLAKNDDNYEDAQGNGRERDDWDSDSEDDLQIVLNDGPMALEGAADDDDRDGELVIVADREANQAMEEQEWGEDAVQVADGERKDAAEVPKGNGGMVLPPKVGYSSHGYHPFHSQFKYIRPGAASIPGSATSFPGGAPIQVRPLGSMGPMAGRGRGDWRPAGIKSAPPMQKGFGSTWGAGHGFGGGLEFTLPSHKNIFEVDINGFEEKPWKYPGADTSDFFNFGFNEESWKDYCRQLEQLRLESTMQSKIRVYESGRMEQDYDPDLPPELAAATGIHDVQAESFSVGKSDIGQSDLVKGFARGRPPLPTGRAIQVEGGCGDRLPSIDIRPPRARDSDAIIEIVCEDSVDDDSLAENSILDQPYNDGTKKDLSRGYPAGEDIASGEMEHFDGITQTHNSHKRDQIGRRESFMNTVGDNMHGGDGILPLPLKTLVQRRPGSQEQSPVVSHEERRTRGRAHERSPAMDPGEKENQKEESVESMDVKQSPRSSSPVTAGVAEESSVDADALHGMPDEISGMENKLGSDTKEDIRQEGEVLQFRQKQKLSSPVEPPLVQEHDDMEDSKPERSSESGKAKSVSKDYEKWQDGFEEEVIDSGRVGSTKNYPDEREQNLQRKREGKQEVVRNRMVVRGKSDSSNNDWGPSMTSHMHIKTKGFERRKEKGNPDVAWQQRDNERRIRTEDKRKRELLEELGSSHRAKVRESERSDKDDHLSSKHLDNGRYRIPYGKDLTSRHRERDENLNIRYEIVDDYHSKRRKHEEYSKDQAVKEEILHGHRESISRRRREREDTVDQRKRNEQLKARDIIDEHNLTRHKDEIWLQRERGERQREEWHRQKQSHEENLLKRGKEGRDNLRGGREDKARIVHARLNDEYKGSEKDYQYKNTVRSDEQFKRRDRIEDESLPHQRGHDDVYAHGKIFANEERRSRQERPYSRNDRGVNPRMHEKKHKESMAKNRESESGDHNTLKRNQDEVGHGDEMDIKDRGVRGNGETRISAHHHTHKGHIEGASSDDERQNSRKGRSKLERWTSQQERDFTINIKKPSSFNHKEIDMNNNTECQDSNKLPDESAKIVEGGGKQHVLTEEKDVGDPEVKDVDRKPVGERHLDTVEKLKKRSERFKQPMRSEKEVSVVKKIENEALPSAKTEIPEESEIKQERPARKRRWISN